LTARAWILLTLLTVVGIGGGVVAMNARLDIYGLFRAPKGRRLPIYDDSERRGKYLLSQRYVPQNFDAILLGSSVTSNWNTSGISVYRTYNESADGGNVTEEKRLAETVLRTPYLTDNHGFNSDEMKPMEYWSALGSTSLLRTYKLMWAIRRGRSKLVWNEFGSEGNTPDDGAGPLKPLNVVLERIMRSDGEIQVDQVAFDEYRALVDELHQRGVTVVAVVPPTMESLLAPRRERMNRYVKRMLTLFSPGDLVVDFGAPEFASFRTDTANFRDGVHLSYQGAAAVIRSLDERLRRAHDVVPPRPEARP
jgi:hypothetical protein